LKIVDLAKENNIPGILTAFNEIVKKLEANFINILALKSDEHGYVDLNSFLKTMHSLKLNSLLFAVI
jgi:hypothetical protein